MGFGNKLEYLLNKKGLTMDGLSIMTGIPLEELYFITQKDTETPRRETVQKIADALNVYETELYSFNMLDSELRQQHEQQKKTEEHLRSGFLELCKMLNSRGLEELLQNAFTLLQDENNWSLIYDQDIIRAFVNGNMAPPDGSGQ